VRFPVRSLVFVLALSTGCAGVSVHRLARDSDYRGGVRFYRPQPYLLVTNYATGERQASIVWLPRVNEEYVIEVHSGVGVVDTKFALSDDWNLTQFGESRDSKTAELLGAAGGLLKAVEAVAPGRGEGLAPGLYAIHFDPSTGLADAVTPVRIEGSGAAR
jgi:hypothetical protein